MRIDIHNETVYKHTLLKGTYNLIKKQKKGGQSAARIGRIAKQDYVHYIDHVMECILEQYYKDNHTKFIVKKLIILGHSGHIAEITDHPTYKKYFKDSITKVVDTIDQSRVDEVIEEHRHIVVIEDHDENIKRLVTSQDELLTYGYEETMQAYTESKLKLVYSKEDLEIDGKCKIIKFDSPFLRSIGGIIGVKWFREREERFVEDFEEFI